MWFAISNLTFIIPVLFLFQHTGKCCRVMKFKRVFIGEGFYTKHVQGNFLGDQRPFDNILKKLIQGYQFYCFS